MKEKYPPIYLGAPGEEIGRKDLRAIKLRFKKLHQIKMQKILDFLHPPQQQFIDLLPLLFHGNYPLLPGFISSSTPAGIFEYSPSQRTLKAACKLITNFTYSAPAASKPTIEGLFLMGSVGSIAFSGNSDIDIWLCHHSELLPYEIDELEKKTQAIENWASTLDLEVHFFLMNSKNFQLGLDIPISSESSGETQHYLLLEEFYRTSVYIAGKSLAWWFIPPHQEHNYTNYLDHLITQRFINENELIDFGSLKGVPEKEFISATIWHIYKSLQSPHKSLLKLLLMECYASEYPNPKWLSLEIKQAVYQGCFTTIDLDPYSLIYLKVEAYLQQTQSVDRLVLARQNFFRKIMASTEEDMYPETQAAREHYFLDIAKRCHWPPGSLEKLKKHRYWDIKKAISEHEIILQQLTHSFRMIMGFASNHANQSYRDSNDLKLIGRKLFSFLEKKPGKIKIITTRNAVHKRELELSIVEVRYADDSQGWSLFLKNALLVNTTDFESILKCRTFIEILAWLVINDLYLPNQKIHFRSKLLNIPAFQLHKALTQLDLFFKRHFSWNTSLANYQTVNTLINSLIFINLGIDFSDDKDNGLNLISECSDALTYNVGNKCLIQTIDRVSISSWSEITSSHHEGIEGLFDCLIAIINQHKQPLSHSDLKIVCYTPIRAKSIIQQRLENIFGTLVSLFTKISPDSAPRYILPGGNAYYIFQYVNRALSYRPLETNDQVLIELARPQEHFSPVYFDAAVPINTPIPLIYSFNNPKTIQLFYLDCKPAVTVYIIDERGALFCQQHTQSNPNQLITQYSIFFESIVNRNFFDPLVNIEYYEIQTNSTGAISCRPIRLKTPVAGKTTNLRITGITTENKLSYAIYCDEKEFSSLDHGNQVFQAVYHHIVRSRASKADYLVHITDIDLPLSVLGVDRHDQLQTIHFLNVKQKIENSLNTTEKY